MVMVRTQLIMYKEMVYIVLLYGSDSWVVTDTIMKVLEGFHHQVPRCLVIQVGGGNGF